MSPIHSLSGALSVVKAYGTATEWARSSTYAIGRVRAENGHVEQLPL